MFSDNTYEYLQHLTKQSILYFVLSSVVSYCWLIKIVEQESGLLLSGIGSEETAKDCSVRNDVSHS